MAALGMESEMVLAGFRYWDGKRQGRPVPARGDLDPVIEIPTLLPHIILFDVRRDPLDFRFRLVGTNVRRNLSRDYVGHWFTEFPNYDPTGTIWPRHKLVDETQLPMLQRPTYIGPHKRFHRGRKPAAAVDRAAGRLGDAAHVHRLHPQEAR